METRRSVLSKIGVCTLLPFMPKVLTGEDKPQETEEIIWAGYWDKNTVCLMCEITPLRSPTIHVYPEEGLKYGSIFIISIEKDYKDFESVYKEILKIVDLPSAKSILVDLYKYNELPKRSAAILKYSPENLRRVLEEVYKIAGWEV